jgi:hypothetical protein
MKQTAVDWLIERLNKLGFAQVVTDEEIKQAKEMEKEQILESFTEGCFAESWVLKSAEKYYNETFGDK